MPHYSPASHSFTSQNLALRYTDWGNPDAPLLLLIHGTRDHSRSWDWVASALSEQWHVVAPDLRGHGDSAWSPDGDYHRTTFVGDLTELVDSLTQGQVTIMAHSLGGNVALRYTGLFSDRVKKLIAVEGLGYSPQVLAERDAIPLPERWRRWLEDRRGLKFRNPRHYSDIESAAERLRAENPALGQGRAHHLATHGMKQNDDGSWRWKFDPAMYVLPFVDIPLDDLHRLWGAVTCPTLLLCGDLSKASNPLKDGRIRHFRSNASVIEIEGAGHWIHHDQPGSFLAVTRKFLDAENS